MIEIAETLKENTGKDMGNDQNEAASNQPILLEWRILKLGPCSRPGIKVIKEQAQTTRHWFSRFPPYAHLPPNY